jgi:predicted GIY-YIG superfamily endonuclease
LKPARRSRQPAPAGTRGEILTNITPWRASDIVRHADYPQWGRGHVIRAKKTATDVFFQWGGKRRIAPGEPLESSRASAVEAEFFALCAGVSAASWSRGHHSVYAVELAPSVWKNRAFRERNPGGAAGGCLYVGVTGLTPEQRFARHQAGTQSGRFVRTHGVRLRLDLVEGFSRLPYRIAARMEPKLAAWLRAQGFAVWQN